MEGCEKDIDSLLFDKLSKRFLKGLSKLPIIMIDQLKWSYDKMKKMTTWILLLFLLVGCSPQGNKQQASESVDNEDTKVEKTAAKGKVKDKLEQQPPNLSKYETVKLEDKQEEFEIEIEYPSFSYAPVDELLSKEMQSQFKNSQKAAKEIIEDIYEDGLGTNLKYSYHVFFEKPVITDEFVSIYFNIRIYMGGASGMSQSYAFNYDLKNQQLLDLEEVLKRRDTNLQIVSKLVADELIHGDQFAEYREDPAPFTYKTSVKGETEPTVENYYAFSLTEDSIILYKQFYSLFPNAAGVVGVEVSWEKIDKATEEKKNDIVYKNDDYHFTLHLPSSWEGKFIVKEDDWNVAAETSYDFQFMHNGKEISNIFSVSVLDTESDGDEEFGPMNFIASQNGKTFVWNSIMEVPPEFWEGGELHELQNEFTHMLNEDLREVIETFTLE